MFFVSLLLHVLPQPPFEVLAAVFVTLGWVLRGLFRALSVGEHAYEACGAFIETLVREREGVVQACLICFWWRRCRRDASRAGVIEQEVEEDGSTRLVLRTLGGVQRVRIVRVGSSPHKLRVDTSGSREVWHLVDPIEDLLRDATQGAA